MIILEQVFVMSVTNDLSYRLRCLE